MSRGGRPKPKVPMYTPEQRMVYVPCKCDPRGFGAGADEAAEQKLTGGFKVYPKNICPDCKEARSVNGMCSCPIVPENDIQKVFFCIDCGIELDQNDVDANLNMFGIFKMLCSDCCIQQ